MEQNHSSCGLVSDPSLVAQNHEAKPEAEEDDTKGQIFYSMRDPLSPYGYRIPELVGRRIRGSFHGWCILSSPPHNVMWSLWNPATCKMIHLPRLSLKDGDFASIKQCCLSSPPDDHTSVLVLTRTKTPTIVFVHLDRKIRKRLRWKEMSYARQLWSITGDNGFLHCLTCCNGKLYALVRGNRVVIEVDIAVKDKKVVITLLAFGKLPFPFNNGYSTMKHFLKGHHEDMFYVKLGFSKTAKKTPSAVSLFKLNTTDMIWEEMEDQLKDATLFLDLVCDCIFSQDAVASELTHSWRDGQVLHSYDVKDKTIAVYSKSGLQQSTQLSLWECKLHDADHEEMAIRRGRDDEVDINNTRNKRNFEPNLVNIPVDVLTMIMELCVGVDYLNVRATCKRCQLAAPIIPWRNETPLRRRRLQTYSPISPWLIVLDKHQNIMTFIDPMFGDKYFITTPQELIGDMQIRCSGYGWLLLFKCDGSGQVFFFNPLTNDILKLPNAPPDIGSFHFSNTPYSAECVVVGLSASRPLNVFVHIPSFRKHTWTPFPMDFGGTTPHSFLFPTFCGNQLYALYQGALHVFLQNVGNFYTNNVVADAPRGIGIGKGGSSTQHFLVKHGRNFMLVVMDELGEFIEVLKWNVSTNEWKKINSLGRYMIYICGNECICMEARTPLMENKIYFPRLHSKSGKIVFYSLETCRYHTLNGRNIQQCSRDLCGTKYHVYTHAWIEPSWS